MFTKNADSGSMIIQMRKSVWKYGNKTIIIRGIHQRARWFMNTPPGCSILIQLPPSANKKALSQNSLECYREATPLLYTWDCGKKGAEAGPVGVKCGKPSKEYSKTAALPDGFSVFS